MIAFNGFKSDRAGVLAALKERAERIAGVLDRVRIDCDLPYLADALSLSAGELHEHAVTALDNSTGGADNAVPYLLSAFDALILVVAMVEWSNMPDKGFPSAQRGLQPRLLGPAFGDDSHPGVSAGVPAASSWCAWPAVARAASTLTRGPAASSWCAWPTAARAPSTRDGRVSR